MPTTKRRALILISSARQLPLVEPADVKSISTGFFLVEMAQVLKEFEDDYEFTFATPDGNVPQLDINGMGLAMHAIEKIGYKTLPLTMQQRRGSFDVSSFRQRHPELVARREHEVQLLERHIGRIPVSELLPGSEPELAEFRPELIRRLDQLPQQTFHSLQDLVQRHRDPADAFTFADFDFIHAPGGHAPMVDFRDQPWLGETLHLARENGVTIFADLPRTAGDDIHAAAHRRAGSRLRRDRQRVPRRHHLSRPQVGRADRDAVRLPPRPRQDDPSALLRRRSHQRGGLQGHLAVQHCRRKARLRAVRPATDWRRPASDRPAGRQAPRHPLQRRGRPLAWRIASSRVYPWSAMKQSKETVPELSPRRATLVEIATGVFTRYGFKKTSMDDVARAAGLSRAGLYLHFANKTELFRAVATEFATRMRRDSREALDRTDARLESRLL